MIRGTIAASVTPLRPGGDEVDTDAVGGLVDFLREHGADGVLAMGSTGEGVLLDVVERTRVIDAFVAAGEGIACLVHAGAQNTRDTARLAAHAASAGADGVAVIAPPYFRFGAEGLLRHFTEAARACAPLPFYVYEFAARSGYAIPLDVLRALRQEADNVAGIKISDSPWDAFAPYTLAGYDVFVGPEGLISRGMECGAVGAVSALAAAFPEVVAAAVASGTEADSARCAEVRAIVERHSLHAAIKHVLIRRGVAIDSAVRAPLDPLAAAAAADLDAALDDLFATLHA